MDRPDDFAGRCEAPLRGGDDADERDPAPGQGRATGGALLGANAQRRRAYRPRQRRGAGLHGEAATVRACP